LRHPGGILPVRSNATLTALLAALALAGCGSQPAATLPPAAVLPSAPPAAEPPAGRVVRTAGTGYAPLHDPQAVTAGGRTFAVDRRGNALRVLEGGREIRRVSTGLEPAAVAAAGDGSQVAVLCVRERVLELFDARTLRRIGRANAGSGPVQVASDGGRYLYVTDSVGGSVLVFHSRGGLALVRRYGLAGNPWAIVHDERRRRLWVTLASANRLAELTTGRRIRRLGDYPTLRQPSAVAADRGGVSVTGREQGAVQLLRPRTR
jgi:DNA-binding beta-propeller fold protein YncE